MAWSMRAWRISGMFSILPEYLRFPYLGLERQSWGACFQISGSPVYRGNHRSVPKAESAQSMKWNDLIWKGRVKKSAGAQLVGFLVPATRAWLLEAPACKCSKSLGPREVGKWSGEQWTKLENCRATSLGKYGPEKPSSGSSGRWQGSCLSALTQVGKIPLRNGNLFLIWDWGLNSYC